MVHHIIQEVCLPIARITSDHCMPHTADLCRSWVIFVNLCLVSKVKGTHVQGILSRSHSDNGLDIRCKQHGGYSATQQESRFCTVLHSKRVDFDYDVLSAAYTG